MRLALAQALFCTSLVFSCVYGGIVGSDGRPGQILGKDARKRYQHDDLELNLNRQNLTTASNENNNEEEDDNQMMADMAADAVTEDGDDIDEEEATTGPVAGLQIDSFQIESKIVSRFATTVVSSRVKNREINATEVSFSVVLPEEAFISNFTMLINNKTIVGDVKEKQAAKAAYDAARAAGQSAGHVEQSPRRMNAFKISVNIGGEDKVEFHLTYQEVLTRVNDYYKHVINIRPGQIVKKMNITLDVKEDAMIKNYHIPKIAKDIGDQTIHQLLKMDDWQEQLLIATDITKHSSHLVAIYTPTGKQQREYSENGINGQFVFLYDVERPAGGEIKAVNGYFVHFFAPEIADAVPKHVIFVIDQSGSMDGTKIRQTKEAMEVILKDLSTADYFNILSFSSETTYWKADAQAVNPDSIADAKSFVQLMMAVGGTNINAALLTALDMLYANSSKNFERYQPAIIFLTDGEATEGIIQPDHILTNIAEKQRPKNQVAIHSISFGSGADFGLLKKISARNGGLARKIYEDSDAAIQLHGFYSEISHPLLTNVRINYLNETVDPDSIVASDSSVYYKGGEVMTVGKLKDFFPEEPQQDIERNNTTIMKVMSADVHGFGLAREHEFRTDCIIFPFPRPLPIGIQVHDAELLPADSLGGFVERMWAYKTIKQLLKKAETQADSEAKKKDLKDKALALSLKYNFVTELTSMVVVQDDKKIEPRFVEEKEQDGDAHRASYAYSMAHAPRAYSRTGFSGAGYGGGPVLASNSYQSGSFLHSGSSGRGSAPQMQRVPPAHADFDQFPADDEGGYDAEEIEVDSVADQIDTADSAPAATSEPSPILSTIKPIVCPGANQFAVDCNHPLICNEATCESVGMTVNRDSTCLKSEECNSTSQMVCVCNYGYVMLNGECVEPRYCPLFNCSGNDALMMSCFQDCEGVCGEPIPIYEQCQTECNVVKCVCQRGFIRNDEGKCVQPAQCDNVPKTCKDANAELNVCGQQCTQRTCEEVQEVVSQQQTPQNLTTAPVSISLPIVCNETCRGPPKCVCRQGFFLRYEIDGQPTCVEIGQCPSYQCGPNEQLNPCGNACDEKCSLKGQLQPCLKICNAPACSCKPGFYRNDNDECVVEDDCEQKPTNETDEFFFL